jgi:hypothetical protein
VTKRKRPERARTLRRASERQADKLAEARRKLTRLEPGGEPSRPIQVSSASVIEPRAESHPCPDCGGTMRCEEHAALTHRSQTLRMARLCCRTCGGELELYFQITEALLN